MHQKVIPMQSQTMWKGTFAWEDGALPVLQDINMEIKRNQLVAVVGQVGSGKTSLLSAMINELSKSVSNAEINVNGKISFHTFPSSVQKGFLSLGWKGFCPKIGNSRNIFDCNNNFEECLENSLINITLISISNRLAAEAVVYYYYIIDAHCCYYFLLLS